MMYGVYTNAKKDGKLYSKYIHILSVEADGFEEAKKYVESKYNGLIVYDDLISANMACDD